MIQDVYEEVRKKHKLPPFLEMDKEFDLCTIEQEHNLLRGIKKKMDDRISYVVNLLETIIHPNAESVVDMYECRFFSDVEKKKVYDLIKQMHYLLRMIDESNVINDDKHDLECILAIHQAWPPLKDESLSFVKKLKEAWKNESHSKEHLNYMG